MLDIKGDLASGGGLIYKKSDRPNNIIDIKAKGDLMG